MQKKWDQPSTSGAPPGAQDPKKTCNLETYLDWSARLRLFVCNEILQVSGRAHNHLGVSILRILRFTPLPTELALKLNVAHESLDPVD